MHTDRSAFDELLRHPSIWKTTGQAIDAESIPTGFSALDAALPDRGWRTGTLTELLTRYEGIGELRLLMPLVARLSQAKRWTVCISPPHVPYAPALTSHDVDVTKFLIVHVSSLDDAFWAAEQALCCEACGIALLWWFEHAPCYTSAKLQRNLRRLQLAAQTGRSYGVVFRSDAFAREASPAALRLVLSPLAQGLEINVIKCRGKTPTRPIVVSFA